MITKEKMALNFDILRKRIPTKPKVYTAEHPIKLKDALDKYSNQRSVNGVQTCTKCLNENHFPLPLWFDSSNIKVGFINKLFYKKWCSPPRRTLKQKKKLNEIKDFDFLWVIVINSLWYKRDIEKIITQAFNVNKKYIKSCLLSNPSLTNKTIVIDEIFKAYKNKYYISCINSLFPIIDFITREFLNTKNLGIDISKICKLFEQNGFGLETANHLMPHITLVSAYDPDKRLSQDDHKQLYEKVKSNNFGIIGPALSSFIFFANSYYGYYKEDGTDSSEINRHAILHGSINSFGTKFNVIKLITFLYLMLELKPVFEILFDES